MFASFSLSFMIKKNPPPSLLNPDLYISGSDALKLRSRGSCAYNYNQQCRKRHVCQQEGEKG